MTRNNLISKVFKTNMVPQGSKQIYPGQWIQFQGSGVWQIHTQSWFHPDGYQFIHMAWDSAMRIKCLAEGQKWGHFNLDLNPVYKRESPAHTPIYIPWHLIYSVFVLCILCTVSVGNSWNRCAETVCGGHKNKSESLSPCSHWTLNETCPVRLCRSTSVRVQPTLQYIYHGTSSILCLSCVYYALYLLGIHGIVVQRLYVGVIRTNLNHCHLVPTGPWMKLVPYAYAGPQAWEFSPHSNIYHVRQLIYSVFVLCILYTVSVGEFMESVIRTNLNHCYLAPTRLAWCPWDFLFDHQILFLGS